jgi:uncharacterized protein YbjT (DUF2867 family)
MKILLTGASGYIGSHLLPILLEDKDISIRLMTRSPEKLEFLKSDRVEIVQGDTLDLGSLPKAVKDIDVAFYLIHAMGTGEDYARKDRLSATNFRDAAIDADMKRIIYLGGLGRKEEASKHLLSRLETGEILSAKPHAIQTIWFRAGIIIGAGSASFEIMLNLVKKLPVMITPKFVSTKTQPVAESDVLTYLATARNLKEKQNLIVDIGADIMSFKEMLLQTAKLMGLRRWLIPIPVFTPKLSSYWFVFISHIPFSLASALIEGLKTETIAQNNNAGIYFPDIIPRPFSDAVKTALLEISLNNSAK